MSGGDFQRKGLSPRLPHGGFGVVPGQGGRAAAISGLAYARRRSVHLFVLGSASIALCSCSSTPQHVAAPVAPVVVAAPAESPDAELSKAIGLLYKGDGTAARDVLLRVLKSRPGDLTATSLVRQIDTPPEDIFGQESFPYKTRPEDTLSLLAERFLGDPTMFYALARYNHIQAPGELEAGVILRIPGRPKPPSPRPPRHAAEPESSAKPVPAAPPPAAPPRANPHRAVQLRAAGLEQLNRGSIDRAVSLLEEAVRLDPGNVLIQRDLDRALKISRAVHAK